MGSQEKPCFEMNREKLLALFPNASKSTIEANSGDQGSRPCAELQKPEKDLRKKARSPKRHRGEDGQDGSRFRVRIAFLFSDDRRRDLDGAATSVMDALIRARRRLLEIRGGGTLDFSKVHEGARGVRDNH